MAEFVDNIGYVGIQKRYRASGFYRNRMLLQESPGWMFVPGSNAADIEDPEDGTILVRPTEEGYVTLRAIGVVDQMIFRIKVLPQITAVENPGPPERLRMVIEEIPVTT